jgi:hypothetical protein
MTMADYELIKKVKNLDLEELKKPKINYAEFDVIVEGKKVAIGVPAREAERFQNLLVEKDSFTRRQFRALMREFRGVRNA